jgi:flagellar basal-body rod modification protein FlgD
MSAIPGTTAADAARQSGSSNVSNDKAMLDKDGFLKMLVAQMTQQDPSSPMDAAQQTQQMASFTMVEQITNMATDNAKTAAVGMIGHQVTYTDPADKTKTTTKSGTVESVSIGRDGAYTLTVSGTSGIAPTSITQVA